VTRKDYEAIAAALKLALPADNDRRSGVMVWGDCVTRVAQVLEQDNPRFDRARFYKAAGVAS
jgi:hypothetical protein